MSIEDIFSSLKKSKWNVTKTGIVSLCPFHNDSTPSFGVSLTKGIYHCFSCKASGTLEKLCEELNLEPLITNPFKKNKKYLKSSNTSILLSEDGESILDSDYLKKKLIEEKDRMTNPSLNPERYAYSNPYLTSRNIDDTLKNKFLIRWDKEEKALFAPIFDLDGRIIANYRRYKTPKLSKCKYSKNFKTSKSLYGLHLHAGQETILITEGINDCLSTYVNLLELNLLDSILPVSCYSSTNFNNYLLNLILKRNIKNIILFFDNDKAGLNGIENVKEIFHKKKRIFTKLFMPDFKFYPEGAKDPDVLEASDLRILLENIIQI